MAELVREFGYDTGRLGEDKLAKVTDFLCPNDKNPAIVGRGLRCSYVFIGDRYPKQRINVFDLKDFKPDEIPLVWERESNHDGEMVVFADLSARLIKEDRELQSLLERVDKAVGKTGD